MTLAELQDWHAEQARKYAASSKAIRQADWGGPNADNPWAATQEELAEFHARAVEALATLTVA